MAPRLTKDTATACVKVIRELASRPPAHFTIKSVVALAHDDIAAALAAGHSLESVCEALSTQGVSIKSGTLRQYMSELKSGGEQKKLTDAPRRGRPKKTPSAPVAATPPIDTARSTLPMFDEEA